MSATYESLCASLSETLRLLQSLGYDVEAKEKGRHGKHCSLVATAAELGHVECITFFDQLGIDLNQKGSSRIDNGPRMNDDPPICIAARKGQIKCMKVLNELGADINSSTNLSGISPVHSAAFGGHFKTDDSTIAIEK